MITRHAVGQPLTVTQGVMVRSILTVALTILSIRLASPLQAQSATPIWSTLARTKDAVVEIDRPRVHRLTPRFADAWTRITYAQADTLDDGQSYIALIQHAVYDCSGRRYRVGQVVAFDRSGRIVKVMQSNKDDTWEPTPPNSVADTERKGACDGQTG